jgi:hypothetical protein
MLQSLQGNKPHHLFLGVFLVLYILIDVSVPAVLAEPVDSIYGKIVLVFLAIIVFMHTNPVLGLLFAVATYFLIQRSAVASGTYGLQRFTPSEAVKVMDFAKYNDFAVTLEEEVVDKMAPLVRYDAPANVDYKPVLAPLYDASPI